MQNTNLWSVIYLRVRLLLCIVFALFTVACYGFTPSYVNSFEGSAEIYEQDESSSAEDVDYYSNEESSDLINTEGETLEVDAIFNSQIEPFDADREVSGLANDASSNANMIETQATFEQGDISIIYPQFESSEDAERIQELNDMIRDYALNILEPLEGDFDDFTIDITYRIPLLTDDFISIIFEGYYGMRGAAGPSLMFYTLNVNLETMQRVTLSDVVHVDEGFANLLLDGEFTLVNQASLSILEDLDTERMLARLLNADSHDAFSYYTEDKLGISLVVGRGAGHNVVLEILYTNENIEFHDDYASHFGA